MVGNDRAPLTQPLIGSLRSLFAGPSEDSPQGLDEQAPALRPSEDSPHGLDERPLALSLVPAVR
jgi:hypothetical protein